MLSGLLLISCGSGFTQDRLLSAIRYKRTTEVRELLEKGADADAEDSNGETPLVAAAAGGDALIVKLLLDHGADPSRRDGWKRTPLSVATSEEVRGLLRSHAHR